MIVFLITFVAGAVGAFFYRCRGGFLGMSFPQLARLIWWAIPTSVAMTGVSLAHGSCFLSAIEVGSVCGVTAFLGLMLPHGQYMDNNPVYDDMGHMSLIGGVRCALIALPIMTHVPMMGLLPLFGALSGAGYWIGWRFLHGVDSGLHTAGFTLFGLQVSPGKFAVGGSEWGEVLTGFAFGAGIGLLGSL